MLTVIKYLFGVVLVLGIGSVAIKSIVSLVDKVRDFIRRKKSPAESGEKKDVKSPSDDAGKEVDEI